MSRIGNKTIDLLNTKVEVFEKIIKISSEKGSIEVSLFKNIEIKISENVLTLIRTKETKDIKSKHGLLRSLIYNAVTGLTKEYSYNLYLQGIGYRVQLKGNDLEFSLGYSHPVLFKCPKDVSFNVQGQEKFTVTSIDKQLIGEVCSKIKRLRRKDSYKGKGIYFENEVVLKKQGKSVK